MTSYSMRMTYMCYMLPMLHWHWKIKTGEMDTDLDLQKDSRDDTNKDCSEDLPVVFQCQNCKSVLSDSMAFLAANDDLKTITVNRVSSSVELSAKLVTSTEGVDQGSTYCPVLCHDCRTLVGKVYRTTPRILDDLRDFYTFEANKLSIYQIGSAGTTVSPAYDATGSLPNMTDLKTLKETILKLQVLMCTMHQRITNIEQSLEIEGTEAAAATQDLVPQALGSNPKQKQSNGNSGKGRVSRNTTAHLGSDTLPSTDGGSNGLEDHVSSKERFQSQPIFLQSFEEKIQEKERNRKRLKKSGNS